MSTTWFDASYPPSVLFPLATGATAGTPGSWTPSGSRAPATVAEANTIGYSGAAWTAGQYNDLDGGADVYWTGSAFATGRAPVEDEGAARTSSRKRKSADG